METKIKIGLFGFGCVGGGLYEVLNQSKLLNAEIVKICVKSKDKERSIDASHFTFEKDDLLNNSEINTIVELIDDADAAYEIVTTAFRKGKNVVSANKKLIALHLEELIQLSRKHQVSFLYEASTCASIPVIRNLEEYYNNDSLSKIEGICNGTTNYILTQTHAFGKSYEEVLKEAQDLGFAETDPTMDVDGFDSKFKLDILIAHTFGKIVEVGEILNIGIRNIKEEDVNFGREKGLKIKLISRAEKIGDKVIGFVAPHFVPEDHFAYNVENEYNCVAIQALFSDKQFFLGKGAGSYPTASAVLSDISALQFDYNYEYKKFKTGGDLEYSNEFYAKVYVGSPYKLTDEIEFVNIEESYSGLEYHYKIGWVKFSSLASVDFNKREDLFISFFSEDVKFEKTKDESRVEALEAAL
ncbi:MAG: homoserine dehydrogenase [Crocinitomicaceae bacterium]